MVYTPSKIIASDRMLRIENKLKNVFRAAQERLSVADSTTMPGGWGSTIVVYDLDQAQKTREGKGQSLNHLREDKNGIIPEGGRAVSIDIRTATSPNNARDQKYFVQITTGFYEAAKGPEFSYLIEDPELGTEEVAKDVLEFVRTGNKKSAFASASDQPFPPAIAA